MTTHHRDILYGLGFSMAGSRAAQKDISLFMTIIGAAVSNSTWGYFYLAVGESLYCVTGV